MLMAHGHDARIVMCRQIIEDEDVTLMQSRQQLVLKPPRVEMTVFFSRWAFRPVTLAVGEGMVQCV